MNRLPGASVVILSLFPLCGGAQVIEFESNGLKYQTLTRSGVTIMFAHLPIHPRGYSIIQAAISNGSGGSYAIKPEDFSYVRQDNSVLRASPSKSVVEQLLEKGSGSDVVKLITTYEAGVYGNPHFRSTNGYESRRQAALAFSATKIRAAAAASAIALVQIKLAPGESTDGAVFFLTENKLLTGGRIFVKTNTDTFAFNPD
jgi:hypothetical protein